MEYLMTYGWALIMIATVVAVLVFVAGSPASTAVFSSSDPAKILLRASSVSETTAEIRLQNATGGKIDITSITPTNYSNCTINTKNPPPQISIGAGSIMELKCTTSAESKGSIRIGYTDYFGLQRTVTINASGTGTSGGNPGEVGLTAYYKFDEGTGTTTTDSSGNGNNGTLLPAPPNGPTWQTTGGCPSGNCIGFDGVNDYIQVGDSDSLDLTNEFTIVLWMKPGNLTQTNKYILSKLGPGDNTYAIIWEYLNDNIEFYSSSYTGSNPRTGSNIPITNTNWHHIVYTYNGSIWAGYRGGENIFSLSRTFSLTTSTGNLFLGHFEGVSTCGGSSCGFNGITDEAKIYNRALTAGEICAVCKEHIPSGGACNCT